MAKLQDIKYYSSPPAVEGQLELGRTWYDYATNQQMGRMMTHAFGSGDDGIHFAFMKILPQGAERYVTYDYYHSPLSLFFGNVSVTEIERTGWGRVLNGDNDEAIIAHHSVTQGTFLWQDAGEAGYTFNQILNVPGPFGPVFPGIAKMGNNFVFMCQLDNLNYTGGDTVLVSTDNMQTWTGHNIIPRDPLATDLGAEFWPEFNPTNANEFSHVYSHNISITAPNGETRLATTTDLGATWNSIQILDDDELIGPDQIQYVAENFGQYCGMYSQDGNYHVVMGAVQGISDPVSGQVDIFPILYWNRNDDVFIELTDLEHGRPANPVVQAALLDLRPGNGLGNAYPQLAEGPDPGELICIWQQWEDDGMGGIVTQIVPPGVEIFMTDIWGAYSNNGGQSWSEPFFVAGTPNQSDVYPNITRNFEWNTAHDSIVIDIAYMYDTNAGVSIPGLFNETSPSECIWYYERRSVSLIQEPNIAVSADTLDFGNAFVGFPDSLALVVSNTGSELLTVSDISVNNPDFTVGITAFSLNPGGTRAVPVIFTPSAVGPGSATLTITSNDPDEPVYPVFLQGIGLIAPEIAVTPDSLSDSLFTGETSIHTLTIDNSGGSDLVFDLSIEGLAADNISARLNVPGASAKTKNSVSGKGQVPLVKIGKGEKDTRVYPPIFLGSGGPDPFGYRWIDSNEPGGPVFNWIDASSGNSVFLSDDDFITGIPLGFTFNYYGTDYVSLNIMSNGWLSFNGFDFWFPASVPAIDGFLGPLAPFAADLYPPGGNYIRYQTVGTAPSRKFVVEFNNIPDFPGGFNFKTFEVVLFEGSNKILYQYLIAPNDPIGFGIESPDETMGMGNAGIDDLFINPALVEDNYAIEFRLGPGWLTADPVSGIIPAGASLDITVTFDATGLFGGDYYANIIISSNDPIHPEVIVPAQLTVDSTVSIDGPAEGEIPERYVLTQNYPNPFNPATTIRYGLPKPSQVKIEVFNLLGERVAVLLDERKPAGYHVITFDAARQGAIASGMYFYRIQAGEFTDQKKMILIK